MYFNSGYLNNSRLDFKDYSKPLVVGSCGTYRLKKRPKLPTFWAKGRRDYQILYVASGKAHFWFNGIEEIVDSGHMVLYKPKEVQKYVYYVEEHPEVFWVHFTGYDVKNILEYHGISLDQHVFYSGTLPEYKMSFRKIIRELQQCEYGYEDYIASLFNNILLLVSRQQQNGENYTVTIPEEIENAQESLWNFIDDEEISNFFRNCSEKSITNSQEEFSIKTSGGAIRFISISISPLVQKINIAGLIILIRDITDKKNQDVILHRMENLANLTNLAAGMAHEIKNPLGAISIHIQLLQKASTLSKTGI